MDGLKHVGFIMDGNGRWATARNKPRLFGHRAGAKAMEEIVPYAFEKGALVLSFYAFSTENFSRPKEEVDGILSLLWKTLNKNKDFFVDNGVRLMVSGDLSVIPEKKRKKILDIIDKTKDYKKTVNILFNYGGRAELLRAVELLNKKGIVSPDEKDLESCLYTFGLPPVDLVIRTSGEKRLSNFLPWQTTYAELYFTDVLWPDFDKTQYDKAVEDYFKRTRRFGKL